MTNKQLAEEILQKVGGKKNINSYSHCSTRLRFDLKDKNSIDKAALERTDGILQVMEVAGQTQVVIGSNVQDFVIFMSFIILYIWLTCHWFYPNIRLIKI